MPTSPLSQSNCKHNCVSGDTRQSRTLRAPREGRSRCFHSPVQCCLTRMLQGSTVKKLKAQRQLGVGGEGGHSWAAGPPPASAASSRGLPSTAGLRGEHGTSGRLLSVTATHSPCHPEFCLPSCLPTFSPKDVLLLLDSGNTYLHWEGKKTNKQTNISEEESTSEEL